MDEQRYGQFHLRLLRGSVYSIRDISNVEFQQGIYVLILKIGKPIRQVIARMGEREFAAGFYSYTGQAHRGLGKRLSRHLSSHKRLHWHIDYLLQAPECQIVRIYIFDLDKNTECAINQRFLHLPEVQVICPRFGASDCRQDCGAHLVYLGISSLLESRLKQVCSDAIAVYE